MSEAAGNFVFMELGQAIQNAREKQRQYIHPEAPTKNQLYAGSWTHLMTHLMIQN